MSECPDEYQLCMYMFLYCVIFSVWICFSYVVHFDLWICEFYFWKNLKLETSLRHVLLKNRLHFSLMDFRETFSNWRTDFRRSTGREWSKEPISTDITTNNNTNFLFIIFLPTFQCTITHFQGNLSSFVSKIKIYSQLFE